MHKRNVKFNALQHGRQFLNECLLLHRLRAWPVQQDDDRSETAKTGTCTDDVNRCWLISNVDPRQRDIGIDEKGDAAMVDRQVVTFFAYLVMTQMHLLGGGTVNTAAYSVNVRFKFHSPEGATVCIAA